MYTSHVNPIRLGLRLVLLVVLSTIAVPAWAQPAPPPRVRLLATGGTISNRTGGRLTAEDLIRSIPDLPRYARPEFEQFSNVSSSALTLAQWLHLARRINEVFQQDRDLAGIVVTSGTDTLEETAYFLNLTVRDARPVVVVGSMRNPSTLGYEGAANLLEGFRVAGEPEARGKGVLVVTSTRTGSGRIAARRAPVQPAAPPAATGEAPGQPRARPAIYIAAEDLAPVKARILLMLALAQTRDPAEIQRMFTQY
jgi:L-asparaginase/Glu-tRNA(Gln) amidotransferase subunit D